jgi:septal ring factor EnvC (AmiA/AmiB activator)
MNKNKHRRLSGTRALAVLWCCVVCSAAAQISEEESLEAVRSQIKLLEERLTEQNVERDKRHRMLRLVEVAISNSAKKIGIIQKDLRNQHEQIRLLEDEIEAVEGRLVGERDALSQQIRMNYLSGRQEKLKLLLNQEDPARLGRMMVYYDYLNRARRERVNTVVSEVANLVELAGNSRDALTRLIDLESTREIELVELERARQERQTAITRVEMDILEAGSNITRLREEEERLKQVVEEVRALLSEFPVDLDEGFESRKGSLLWPVPGTFINNYGDVREEGQLIWNGVLVSAPSGTLVRAVHHGRIAYADWLPGVGLLVIVDHGDGYMSLYGHNETILKESGDWVVSGEAIAQVGDSGGQARQALYFEIRHDGAPTDPSLWLVQATQR